MHIWCSAPPSFTFKLNGNRLCVSSAVLSAAEVWWAGLCHCFISSTGARLLQNMQVNACACWEAEMQASQSPEICQAATCMTLSELSTTYRPKHPLLLVWLKIYCGYIWKLCNTQYPILAGLTVQDICHTPAFSTTHRSTVPAWSTKRRSSRVSLHSISWAIWIEATPRNIGGVSGFVPAQKQANP